MKKLIFLSFLLLLLCKTDAQKSYELKFEPIQKAVSESAFWADSAFSYFATFKDAKDKKVKLCSIEKMSANFVRSNALEFNVSNTSEAKGSSNYFGFYYLGNNFLVAHTVYTRPKTYVYLTLFGWDGKQLARNELIVPGGPGQIFQYLVSDDRSKILCYNSSSSDLKMHLLVLNDQLNVLWERTDEFKQYENRVFSNFSVSGNGNVYYTHSFYERELKNYLKCIVANTDNGKKMIEIPLFYDGVPLEGALIKLGNDEHVFISGYLAKNNKGVTDVIHMSLNGLTQKFEFQKKGSFSQEFVQALSTERDINEKKGIVSFSIPSFKKIVPKKDGGYYTFRSADDIIVVTSVSNRGIEIWNSYIPKGIFLHMGNWYSFDVGCLPNKDVLYVLYSDAKKNINAMKREQTKEFDFPEACIALAIINEKGQYTKEIVFEPQPTREDQRLFFQPSVSRMYNDGILRIFRGAGEYSQNGYFRIIEKP
jgi:hypothetical protein